MPTSTLWRRDASAPLGRGSSPVRPTLAVERISPERESASASPLVGLGLVGYANGSETAGAAITTTTITTTANNDNDNIDTRPLHAIPTTPPTKAARPRAHARSHSTIDDLADAAIATSPPLPGAGPAGAPRPATSHITRYGSHDAGLDAFGDPPAKRVKSDIVRQYEFSFGYEGPPAPPADHAIPHEDVALLLALKQEVNFKTQPSPVVPAAAAVVPAATEPERPRSRMDAEQMAAAQAKAEDVAPKKEDKKKARRVRPLVQAEVCAQCGRLQHGSSSGDDEVAISWICCNPCNRWFHSACVGFKNKAEARSVDRFVCTACQPAHGPSTFVRTSSRARTAIDYAELNQGLVKSAVDSPLHHYIEPLKTGKFAMQPDDFMRVPPELVTADFLQSFDGMKRPFVVPAAWNPRHASGSGSGSGSKQEAALLTECFDVTECFDSSGNSLGRDTAAAAADDVATETVIDCDQDLLDMVMPRDLSVRTVAELYGKHNTVAVIDVKSQESKALTLEQWADYYEATGDKPVKNVISLEVSQCPLGRVLRRPRAVRDLDLEDAVWTAEARGHQKRRHVQYYCLMSVADSYTDFHIDFGGSSVYYHILSGIKTFFFIPPEDRYLRRYEEWCNSPHQSDIWLPDLCNGNVTRVDLHAGDTAFIPAGWIHSVWTPCDSLVIGGNFLTAVDYELQFKVVQIEKATHVASTFRYPYFQKVMWYALIQYLDLDPVPDHVAAAFVRDPDHVFLRATPVWLELGHLANDDEPPGSPAFNARYYPRSEVRGWPALRDYIYRTARVHADLPVDNINKKQIDAVKASIPRGHGDPLALIKTFAIWCCWKIGNLPAPPWLYSDTAAAAAAAASEAEAAKKAAAADACRVPGERTSLRRAAQLQLAQRDTTGPAVVTPYKPGFNAAGVNPDPSKKGRPPSARPVAARVACEACRRRRVKCKHKDAPAPAAAAAPSLQLQDTAPPSPLPPRQPAASSSPQVPPTDLPDAAGVPASASNPPPTATTPKKSRSKACDECRKSKRRCVHDQFGRVDPAKAAEPSKPRGSSSAAKRPARPSDDGLFGPPAKRVKLADDDALDPALFAAGPGADEATTAADETTVKVEPDGEVAGAGLADATITVAAAAAAAAADPYEDAIVDSPESGHAPVKAKRESSSPAAQRHSSRQPKQVDRFVPTASGGHSAAAAAAAAAKSAKPRRNSSALSATTAALKTHPHPVNATSRSAQSSPSAAAAKRRPRSLTTPSRARSVAKDAPLQQHQHLHLHHVNGQVNGHHDVDVVDDDDDDDEDEDERLARQLQAQEHGLRRRTVSGMLR